MLEKLIALVPPPKEPKGVPSAAEWDAFEMQLGSAFPSDYKRLIETYGQGWFADWIQVLLPNEVVPLAPPEQGLLNLGMRHWQNPYPIFPATGGILWCGRDDGNSFFAWLTEGLPDQWTVINFNNRFIEGYHRPLPLTLTELLAGWFSGELTGDWYPEDVNPIKERHFTQ